MSDISTKLTYLNTTKSQLKDMINYGLDSENQITSSTTFREYVSSIFEAFLEALRNPDTLFNNLPKTSGSGSQITLNGTAYAPMRINLNPTAISQDGTPTPSSPQDIHTISGNNSVVVEGKNLFDTFVITNTTTRTIENDGTIVLNNASSNPNGYHETEKKLYELCPNLKAGDTAYLYVDTDFYYQGNKRDLIYLGEVWNSGTSKTITDTLLNKNVVIYGGYQTTSHIKISITKNSVATTYTPYVSQTAPINLGSIELGIMPNTNYKNEFVRSDGENSFSTDYKTTDTFTTYTKIDNNSFSYTCSGTWKGATFVVPCEKNTDYFFLYSSKTNDGTTTYCRITGTQTSTDLLAKYENYFNSFNTGENTTLTINISNGNHSLTSGTITEIMLNKGTTALPYTPYEKGWYYKQGIKKLSLAIADMNNGENYPGWVIPDLQNIFEVSSNTALSSVTTFISNIFEYGDGIYFNGANSVWLRKSVFNLTQTEWKTNYPNLVLNLYYGIPSAKITYTKITGELANQLEQVNRGMLSYDGTTNISQVNNDLAFGLVGSAILGE